MFAWILWMALQVQSQGSFGYRKWPEPMDVPAVKEPSKEAPNGPMCIMTPCEHKLDKWCTLAGYDQWPRELCEDHPPLVWTCADKTRVLLTAEDGTKHCIKFPESAKEK